MKFLFNAILLAFSLTVIFIPRYSIFADNQNSDQIVNQAIYPTSHQPNYSVIDQTIQQNNDQQDNKIVVIDINLVLEQSIAAQNIRSEVEVISRKVQKIMDDETNSLKLYEDKINKQKNIIAEKEFEQELLKFNKRVSALQRQAQDSKARIEKAYSEAISKVHEKILKIINEISYEENFDLVIPAPVVVYAKTKLNITNKVIAKINIELNKVDLDYQE